MYSQEHSTAIRKAFRSYCNIFLQHPLISLASFVIPALGTILVFFVPTLIIAKLIDIFVAEGAIQLSLAWHSIILFATLWLLGEILWRIGAQCFTRLKVIGMTTLAKDAFDLLTKQDYAFYSDNFVGSLTKKTAAYSVNFDMFSNALNYNIFNNVFPAIFAFVVLAKYSLWLPLILIVALTMAILIAIPIIKRRSQLVMERHQASSRVSGRLSDMINNMLAIKSYARESFEAKVYNTHIQKHAQTFKKAADFQNLRLDVILSPIYVGTNVLGIIAAIFFAQKLGLAAGAVVVVFSYFSQITRIFWEINHTYRMIENALTEGAEFHMLFESIAPVSDKSNAYEMKTDDGTIQFRNVCFEYTGQSRKNDETFLSDFCLTIADKQKVGLVGPSGGGKTTITKLILRFLDLQQGSIRIGKYDISSVTQESLRNIISYVPQEPFLFHRSIFENIAYGKENATLEEVQEAAKLARADEFIDRLPQGYDTMVGERGIKLSGGQKQRVAIARAILRNARILVLDEATSALDSESEKYIQDGLWELMKNKTALVVAHRLSTIKHLDRIVVLDNGKILEDGTHDELVKRGGLYAKLWSHQSGEFM